MPRGVRRNKLDSQILGIVCQHQEPISVRAICALAFPGLSWEDARKKVRQWPEHEGVLTSAAWLVPCSEVAPCPAR